MSGGFQLDTTGFVWLKHGQLENTYWEDLSPFEQGYIEALLTENAEALAWVRCGAVAGPHEGFSGFSDLSPSALERIRKDCGGFLACYPDWDIRNAHEQGLWFWRDRQAEALDYGGFPPLQPFLSNEGQVELKERG